MTTKTKKVHENLDMLGNFIAQMGWEVLAADPGTTYARTYYNSVSHTFRAYEPNAAAWSDLGSGVPADGTITLAKLANLAQATVIGRAAGAGTGVPVALTGTQIKAICAIVAADVSDFNTAVRTNALNQMTAPTADLSINSHKLTNVTDGTADTDAATVGQVGALLQGLDFKNSVRVASTANGTLATAFANGQTVDGITLATGDRILLKDQSTGAENGIYTVNASGAPTRALDMNVAAEVPGAVVGIEVGTANADTVWLNTNDVGLTLGSTALVFTPFPGLGALLAGTGLTKTGNTIDAVAGATPGSGGPGGGLVANANDLVIDTAIVTRKYAVDIGDGSTEDIVVTHSLGTRDIQVTVRDAASPYAVHDVYWEATSTSTCTVFFPTGSPPASAALRCVVQA